MSAPQDLERHLHELETRVMRPATTLRQDLEEILAEDFVEFGSSGTIWDRNAVIAAQAAEAPAAWFIADFKVKLLAEDVALVTYVAAMTGRGSTLRCSIWKRDAGRWRMTFHQGTRAK
jgi:glyoxylase I family protein